MNKDKKKVAEIFLNHALEIIYLLTGEEYTIVKKNSSHIHQLTGEVPIKCEDVAVYFSMEEWEYIEGHKELYKDVMMKNPQKLRTLQSETHNSPEHHEDNLHTESFLKEVEDEGDKNNIHQVEIHPEPYVGDIKTEFVPSNEQIEELRSKNNQLEAQEQEVLAHTDQDGTMSSRLLEESTIIGSFSEGNVVEEIKAEYSEWNFLNESSLYEIGNQTSTPMYYQSEENTRQLDGTLVKENNNGMYRITEEKNTGNDVKTTYGNETAQSTGNNHHGNKEHVVELATKDLEANSLQANVLSHKITYVCPECRKCFTRKSSLATHFNTHTGDKPYSCYQCGKCFLRRANMVAHYQTHTNERPHTCHVCGKCFTKKSSLVTHHKTHTGEKPFSCLQCGKCFVKRSNLDTHYMTHTNEKPHVCPDCGKCFTLRSYLDKHHRTHTGEKPYACPACGKRFTQRTHMVIHQRTHTGEKPYVCPKCGKGFTRRTHMVMHQRIHTEDKSCISL
ncbi:uncharacterized protein O3C94_016764 [Discoglossus pictus]